MPQKRSCFRIGRVQGYLRGRVWYLCYHEGGRRRRPRAGSDLAVARRLAAQTNAQLETGDAAMLSFEPIAIAELRRRWLEHHEHVLRSSVHTINRYRTATDHLLAFLREQRPVRLASQFSPRDAEAFVVHLRTIEVAPNGHAHSVKRKLYDKGIKYILEACRALFTYAAKRRHLSPYAENPFTSIEIDRIPVEESRPIILFTSEQETRFLEACDEWQFPIFLTLMLTGLRPGELVHLLLPDDLDLDAAVLRVGNKPKLGWQVKTRSQREIPLLPELVDVLRVSIGDRRCGPVFWQRRCQRGEHLPLLADRTQAALEPEAAERVVVAQTKTGRCLTREEKLAVLRGIWRDVGAISEDRVRGEFIRINRRIGMQQMTSPKVLRHLFATKLQDANVDPLVRNLLMGHAPCQHGRPAVGLGMTAVYTHTRAETVRGQLLIAMAHGIAIVCAQRWLAGRQAVVKSLCAPVPRIFCAGDGSARGVGTCASRRQEALMAMTFGSVGRTTALKSGCNKE